MGKLRLGLLGLVLVWLLLLPALALTQSRPDFSRHAGLVVRFADETVETFCIDLGADGEANSFEVLELSGLEVQSARNTSDQAAVCKVEDDGCTQPGTTCFCQCPQPFGDDCRYWSNFHLVAGAWEYGGLQAESHIVRAGDVEGWAWGLGKLGVSGTPPPVYAFEDICNASTFREPTPTPEPQFFVCPRGEVTVIEGVGPPATALILFFDGRPVGGTTSDGMGLYQLALTVEAERPGSYLVQIKTRNRQQVIREAVCEVPEPEP